MRTDSYDLAGDMIYIAASGIWRPDVVKIGTSRNVENRMRDLHAFPIAQCYGGEHAEAFLHRKFAEDRIEWEYFRLSRRVIAFTKILREHKVEHGDYLDLSRGEQAWKDYVWERDHPELAPETKLLLAMGAGKRRSDSV